MDNPILRTLRPDTNRPLTLLAATLAALLGCESGGTSKPDGGGGGSGGNGGSGGADAAADRVVDMPVDMPIDPAPPVDAPAGGCDPVKQDCPAGQRCQFTCPAPICIAEGTMKLPHGSMCDGMTKDCAKEAACVSDYPGSPYTCLEYCQADSDCPTGKTCSMYGPTCTMGVPPTWRLCTP